MLEFGEFSKVETRYSNPSAPKPLEQEVERIRAAYARREKSVPQDLYSPFKEANLLSSLELQREIIRTVRRFGHSHLEEEKVLDVGCGKGFWLRQLIQWGSKPENLFGVDLLEEKVREARKLCPERMTLRCGDASRLEFEDETFDLVMQFTVFTSILDTEMKKNLADEMYRVLKPGGAILWYDYFVSNPRNPDVRGVSRKEISRIFPGLSIFLKRITLAPPLGRVIGPISPAAHRMLSAIKPLCTHYLGFLQKA
jgi:ubiquinone/menaquinone biosynthesis C-methylase UbiE